MPNVAKVPSTEAKRWKSHAQALLKRFKSYEKMKEKEITSLMHDVRRLEAAAIGDTQLIDLLRWKVEFNRRSQPYASYPEYPGPGVGG